MSLHWEMTCDNCDDDTIIIKFDEKGKLYNYSWYQCVNCGGTDWQTKTPRKFRVFAKFAGGK